jgi:hypothetical protein
MGQGEGSSSIDIPLLANTIIDENYVFIRLDSVSVPAPLPQNLASIRLEG